MKNLLIKIASKIARIIIPLITKQLKNRIVLMQESFSGSSSYALIKYANEGIKLKYELVLYHENDAGLPRGVIGFLKKYRLLASARAIISTHQAYKPSKNTLSINLFHGMPIKQIGVLELKDQSKYKRPKNFDYLISYSKMHSISLNYCFLANPDQYIIAGGPRNDFLFKSDGLTNMAKIFGDRIIGKFLIYYTPTYRVGYYGDKIGNKDYSNPFGFNEFNSEEFDSFLKENNSVVILKFHPHDEHYVLDQMTELKLWNCFMLKSDDLNRNKIDFYELLNACNILLTDYSSIYIDYLLLNKPVIFLPIDISEYRKTVGLLLEPYEKWTPGPKVFDQQSLQSEIIKLKQDSEYYEKERNMMRDIFHEFQDDKSSQRVWEFIDRQISGNNT